MSDALQGQVSRTAADIYEEFFVPALFQDWANPLLTAAKVRPGQTVLDVACGTGVVARTALSLVQPGGSVIGLDRNDGMLTVAKRLAPEIQWQPGLAEDLTFPDHHFDAVLCQFGLMFFEDQVAALREMMRVLRPGGRLAVAVWDSLDHSAGYADMTALLQRLFGDDAANALRAPFTLGDPADLRSLFQQAGIAKNTVDTLPGKARFPSIAEWVHTDVKGWTLADMIDDAQYELLQQEAQANLTHHQLADGTVEFPAPAHFATATKA